MHCCPWSSGLAVLDPSRATLRPGHTPQLPGWVGAFSGLPGQKKGCRLCEVGGSTELHGGGGVRARSAQGLLADAQCGNVTENRCGKAAPTPHAQAPGPWRKPLSGEPRLWGGFTLDFQVHPDLAFGALRTEEVTVTGSYSLFPP